MRCQAHRCASGRADSDERELLIGALVTAAGEDAGPPSASVGGAGGPRARSARAVPIELRRTLAAAATRWGARVGSPVLAIEQLVQLRYLVAPEPGPRPVGRLVDLVMVHACRGATDELQRAAFSDALTGCANRRAFERDLERELARCARAELDLSVVAVDLDGLKAVNDSQGHAAGDRQLVQLVDTLRRALRSMDGVYRLGGDEFGIVMPDTSLDDAAVVMARALRLGAPKFSWGTASYLSTGCAEAAELLAVADTELYARRRAERRVPVQRDQLAHADRAAARTEVEAVEREPVSAVPAIGRSSPTGPFKRSLRRRSAGLGRKRA